MMDKLQRTIKDWSLPIYFAASMYVMEVILRLTTVGDLFSPDLSVIFLFSMPVAALFFMICSIGRPNLNRILSAILLGTAATIFASQIIYQDIFTTFYSMYSAGRAAQIFEFWEDILISLGGNFLPIILLYSPMALLLGTGRLYLPFDKICWKARGILACLLILSVGSSILAVHAGGRDLTSAYSLYYERSFPVQSVQRLGLLTTMRLDLQRLVSGWSPVIEPPPLDDPVWVPDPVEDPVEYNSLDINFQALIDGETDETIKDMHRYFASLPASPKNDFTGKYQGYNLIFITAEGFSHLAVREDVTPTLYKLVHEGYNFTNFYTPLWGVSTSDGEYVACTGLIPKQGVWSFKRSGQNSMPLVMGNQFKRLGYQTMAYHDHAYKYYGRNISHPNMGYEYKGIGKGLVMTNTWPRSDLEMMKKTIPEYIGQHQFHTYYMTVSGHLNYTFRGNTMAYKNEEYVDHLPYSEGPRAYLATQIELDKALEYLLQKLEEAGIADRTLIAISADHYPYGLKRPDIEELEGKPVDNNFDLYRNAFILWTKGMDPITIDEPSCSLDIIPTLSNLMGLEYDSRLLMGRDIHSDTDPLVIFADGSFITAKGRYDINTGKFHSLPGVSVEEGYVQKIISIVNRKVYYSAMILDKDYYAKVLPDR